MSPSPLERAANFARAAAAHAAAGRPRLPPADVLARLEACESCAHFTPERTCRLCGCRCDVKAAWAEQHCPIRKWPGD